MSNDYLDTFKKIQKGFDTHQDSNERIHLVPDQQSVMSFLNSDANNNIIESYLAESNYFELTTNQVVSNDEIEEMLNNLKEGYDKEQLKLLVDSCRVSTLDAIIKPFGLAGMTLDAMSKPFGVVDMTFKDKIGGNVDTINNVRKDIYSTTENKARYDQKPKYDYDEFHDKNENYKKHTKIIKVMKMSNQNITDAYTKKPTNDPSVEHIISAKRISDDPAITLARVSAPEIANDDNNLVYISKQLNSSIKEKSPVEYIEDTKKLSPELRQYQLDSLNKRDEPLSPYAEKRKNLIEQKNAILENEAEVKQIEANARKKIDRKLNKTYYTSKDFMKNAGKTGAAEGFKMGTQQALGLLLREFAVAVFDEIGDIFSTRHDLKVNTAFLHNLNEKLVRISKRLIAKWKDVVDAFKEGAISGFFSNIITAIVNAFITTSKRVVKIIREGFYSLFRAIKLLMFPPENMTKLEAAHESTKLISAGLIISGGILIEESLQKALATVPVIGIFSDLISSVLLGIVTGLSMALITYLIDKLDLFKVNDQKRKEYVSSKLDTFIEQELNDYDEMYDYLANTLGL